MMWQCHPYVLWCINTYFYDFNFVGVGIVDWANMWASGPNDRPSCALEIHKMD